LNKQRKVDASIQATLPVGYTFNNFNFTYDPVGNLTALPGKHS